MNELPRARSVALLLATAAMPLLAQAQADCSKLVPDLQGRCEAINRMQRACAGLSGKEYHRCERENIQLPVVEDCSTVQPAARAMCEAHNRAAQKAEKCNGTVGAELAACKRANGLNPPTRH